MAGWSTVSNTRTCSLLVYGSLMHRDERLRAGFGHDRGVPVRLAGFARDFSQRPSWRNGRGSARGVLRVRECDRAAINAVLVPNVPVTILEHVDQRERGYLRRPVDLQRIAPFEEVASIVPTDEVPFIYEGRGELHAPDIMPNPEYLSLCLAAARQWGEDFEQTFLATTFIRGHAMNAPCWRSAFRRSHSLTDVAVSDGAGNMEAGLQ